MVALFLEASGTLPAARREDLWRADVRGSANWGGNAYEKKEHDHALDRHVFGGGSAS